MFKNFKYLSSLNKHGVILNKHAAATPVQILNIFFISTEYFATWCLGHMFYIVIFWRLS